MAKYPNISKGSKTLIELIEICHNKTPEIRKLVDRIILENPDLTSFNVRKGVGINLDKLVGIAILDFLFSAFSKNESGWEHGYVGTHPQN